MDINETTEGDDEKAILEPVDPDRLTDELTKTPIWMIRWAFFLCGISHFCMLSLFLDIMAPVLTYRFPNSKANLGTTITGAFELAGFGASALCIYFQLFYSSKVNLFSGLLHAASCIATPLVLLVPNMSARRALYHIGLAVAGATLGSVQSVHFPLAATTPYGIFSGWISMGQGVSGLIIYGWNLLLIEVVFEGSKVVAAYAITATLSAILMLTSCLVLRWLFQRPDLAKYCAEKQIQHKAYQKSPDRASTWSLVKLIWPSLYGIFVAMFLSFLIYPGIAPLRWRSVDPLSLTQVNTVIGMFQIGNLLGRILPSLHKSLLLTNTLLVIATTLTIILVILSCVAAHQAEKHIWQSWGTQVILVLAIGLTNGWYSTVGYIRAPMAATDEFMAGRLAGYATLSLLTAVAIGPWLAAPLGDAVTQ